MDQIPLMLQRRRGASLAPHAVHHSVVARDPDGRNLMMVIRHMLKQEAGIVDVRAGPAGEHPPIGPSGYNTAQRPQHPLDQAHEHPTTGRQQAQR